MIEYQTVIDFLSDYGKLYIKGENISLRCPLCGDSKKSKIKRRFSVTYDNGLAYYNCFNCGRSGTFSELYAELKGVPISEAIKCVSTPEFDKIYEVFNKKRNYIKEVKKNTESFNYILSDCIDKNTKPKGYLEIQYQKILKKFIQDRYIPDEYNVYIDIKGDYKSRIILPIFEEDKIVYFQGRAINSDIEPKYLNPIVEKSEIIMNKNLFDKDKYIIVTEGIIDSMMVEYNQGTCVLGGSISDEFLSKLYKYTNKGIIIAVDMDSRGKQEREKLTTESICGKILYYSILPKPYKDLNEFKINNSHINIYDYVVENKKDYFNYIITERL